MPGFFALWDGNTIHLENFLTGVKAKTEIDWFERIEWHVEVSSPGWEGIKIGLKRTTRGGFGPMTCRVEQQRVICEESSHSSSNGRNVFVADKKQQRALHRAVGNSRRYRRCWRGVTVNFCISSSSGHWLTSKLPQQDIVLSCRKIDFQTMQSSRSQLESSADKPFTSSSANQTKGQDVRTTALQVRGWR